jgi:hypothetical protein
MKIEFGKKAYRHLGPFRLWYADTRGGPVLKEKAYWWKDVNGFVINIQKLGFVSVIFRRQYGEY